MIVDDHMHLRAPDGEIELSADAVERFGFDTPSHPDLAKINDVRGSDDRCQELAAAIDAAGRNTVAVFAGRGRRQEPLG